ncbi:hypothetical protein GmHk_19G053914 [Glycine max]|nr:hypothetical protein GYH30_051897 [Glycine max]KAH1192758.1 hypothetical protein GmHk_19G053914 [Glycine max]
MPPTASSLKTASPSKTLSLVSSLPAASTTFTTRFHSTTSKQRDQIEGLTNFVGDCGSRGSRGSRAIVASCSCATTEVRTREVKVLELGKYGFENEGVKES